MADIARNMALYHLIIAAIIVAAFTLLSGLARRLISSIGHRIFVRTATVLDDRIVAVVLTVVKPLMIVTGLQLAVREVRKGIPASDLTLHEITGYAAQLLFVVIVLLVVKVVLGVCRELITWYLNKASAEGSSGLASTLGPLTTKAANILVGMVAIIVVLDHFGINIGSLLVSLGVGSLAVALAAQDTLANMIAGFVILIDRPFRVGDRIEISTGQVGDVQQIGLRSTRLVNPDNNVLIMPNADLVKGRIVNYSHPYLPIRVAVRYDIAFGVDPDEVRRLLLRVAATEPNLLKDPEVHLTGMTDSAVQCTLVGRTSEFDRQFATEGALREKAYQEFLKEGIAMPVPQRVLYMKNVT